ncbi:hypothetical protein GIB67_033294 [Kingdonia uniflora]|uniref:Cation/H+ exchanger domain-containing protein n=1 Tax=Kingdonia uniflora TaxID=39325 RepID=A0A7J7LJR7_9MAGN|nr:hypothetical protein GIB67_033294 [Kingdonia uniflora]
MVSTRDRLKQTIEKLVSLLKIHRKPNLKKKTNLEMGNSEDRLTTLETKVSDLITTLTELVEQLRLTNLAKASVSVKQRERLKTKGVTEEDRDGGTEEGGLLIGPSGLGRTRLFKKRIFPVVSFYPLSTLGLFGCMFFLFLVGVKMDLKMVKRSGKKAWAIGLLTFILPLILTVPISFYLRRYVAKDNIRDSLPLIAVLNSSTSFHVITCLLTDLKLLNSELGRLATSASTISGMLSWITLVVAFSVKQSIMSGPATWILLVVSGFVQVMITVYVLRPIVMWMIRNTPEGKPFKETHMFTVFLMILGSALVSELFGQHFSFGPMVLGLILPDGPPLGSALADKLDCFVSGLLLPLYFFLIGRRADLHLKDSANVWVLGSMSLLAVLGKFAGSILPALYCKVRIQDAIVLGLILSSLGIVDLTFYSRALANEHIDTDTFTILVTLVVLITGTVSPLVQFFYKPSKRYGVFKKHTIQYNRRNTELKIIACIYNQENVPAIIKLLEASNPTRESPMGVYVLHLVELMGRATPLLVEHNTKAKPTSQPTQSDRIINAFRIYEQQNQGVVTVTPFTAISAFTAVHEDICELVMDRIIAMVIIPFHKQWSLGGDIESIKCRNVNKNIIENAPCSVGILVDRGILGGTRSAMGGWTFSRVGVIFFGGPDDREALSYAMRMAEHPNINVSVVRLVAVESTIGNAMERKLDNDVVNLFRLNHTVETVGNDYREEQVLDSVGTVDVMHSMENSFDLVIMGRRQNETPILSGLTEWNEFPELGLMGDLLASYDFESNISILVVKQLGYALD